MSLILKALSYLIPYDNGERSYKPPKDRLSTIVVDETRYFPSLKGLNVPFLEYDFGIQLDRTKMVSRTARKIIEQTAVLQALPCCEIDFEFGGRVKTFENALSNSLAVYLQSTQRRDVYEMPLHFHNATIKTSAVPIDCTLRLKRTQDTLTLFEIDYDGSTYTPKHTQWKYIVDIAMCACGTSSTLQEHFMRTHILIVASIYICATSMSHNHPIFEFLHIHGGITPFINAVRGVPLVNDCFAQDFSFTPAGLKEYFIAMRDNFNIYEQDPVSRIRSNGFRETTDLKSTAVERWVQVWKIFATYVNDWVDITYKDFPIYQDEELKQWWSNCRKYQFLNNLGPLSVESLKYVLTVYVYHSIYWHDVFGDGNEVISALANTMIAKDYGSYEQRLAKQFFEFIFTVATRAPGLKLLSNEWTTPLSDPYQRIAERLQRSLKAMGFNDLEVACNK